MEKIVRKETSAGVDRDAFRPFLTRNFFQEILGLEGSKKILGKNREVHNLKISDRLLGRFLWEQKLVQKS